MKLEITLPNKSGALWKLLGMFPWGTNILHISSFPQENQKAGINLTIQEDICIGEFEKECQAVSDLKGITIKEVQKYTTAANQNIVDGNN